MIFSEEDEVLLACAPPSVSEAEGADGGMREGDLTPYKRHSDTFYKAKGGFVIR
jgi:hypothetical protein